MKKRKLEVNKPPQVISLLFIGTLSVVLFFNPRLQDPFNAPKMWILMLIAAVFLGYLFFPQRYYQNSKVIRNYQILIISFLFWGFISAIYSDNKLTSILGENGRKNGFVTYVALSIITLVASRYINFNSLPRFNHLFIAVSVILIIYGYMQISGNDFVQWNNPYNSVIGTAGNPNFSSAIYAILCTFICIKAFNSITNFRSFIPSMVISIFLFLSIYNTDSLQGILAFGVGFLSYVCIIALRYKKIYGLILTTSVLILVSLSILGMLQKGPFKYYLYKETVSLRGFYWQAGLDMLKNFPLTGVGLDNYGNYFNYYRSVDYPLRFGFEVTSTNAHNTFIQNFATGGFFYGLLYLIIVFYIAYCAINLLKFVDTNNRGFVLAIFGAWITFQAQSLVSIDNIAIAVVGWVLGGMIVGLSARVSSGNETKKQVTDYKVQQMLASNVLVIAVFIFVTFLYRAESSMMSMRGLYNPSVAENNLAMYAEANRFLDLPFTDSYYRNQVAIYLGTTGHSEQAFKVLEETLKSNPRSLDTLNSLANLYESAKKFELAIPVRLRLAELNPWNAKNYLQLGKNYLNIGDYDSMDLMLEKISSFAINSEVNKIAKSELVRPNS
jgi:O-antigen ligase